MQAGHAGFCIRRSDCPRPALADIRDAGLYSHFTGVRSSARYWGRAVQNGETPPYPPDAAAVQHVFDGGWMWVLRFDSGVVSAGVALTEAAGAGDWPGGRRGGLGAIAGAASLGARSLRTRRRCGPLPMRLSWPGGQAPGRRAGLGDAAVCGGLCGPVVQHRHSPDFAGPGASGPDFGRRLESPAWIRDLAAYAGVTLAEADSGRLYRACYAAMSQFPCFRRAVMFYLRPPVSAKWRGVWASRIWRGAFWPSGHSEFGPVCAGARPGRGRMRGLATQRGYQRAFEEGVAKAIDCLNMAGLCEPRKRHWYGVDLADVVAGGGVNWR